jgi:CRISPR-associated endonuclease/helicase Cas3
MSRFDYLLAKSLKVADAQPQAPTYAKLVPHLRAVERVGESIAEIVGETILQQLGLSPDHWLLRLKTALRVACVCHDIGKANEGFQQMVRGKLDPTRQPARHELLSALLLEDKNSLIRQWALKLLKTDDAAEDEAETLLDCVIGAVAGHHLKLGGEWKRAAQFLRGGCGVKLQMLLTHPDLQFLFHGSVVNYERCFSLVEGEQDYLGDRRLPFNFSSNRWRNRVKDKPEWWRFAAALKALMAAADVAGSAMLPEKENIRKWVHQTLSQRVSAAEMNEVVAARLDGKAPRPFQEAIGRARKRVTLVEAGCGGGKTAAAYLWAAHHADRRKLFFCYPTTGTATEGFLGYVHETDIEAKLIHSRAIVDLEGISEVTDDEENDHLLRIESLNAWSPKVIICTADTVLALVRNNRRGLYNSPAILSGSFVFDELHAYDNRMFAAVVALIKAMPGASFLLMTASLPKARKDFLFRHLEEIEEVPSPRDLEEIPRYEFQQLEAEEEAHQMAEAAVAHGQRVLWVCNTVARAQKAFSRLQAKGLNVSNYHSRFKYEDRKEKHRHIVDTFAAETSIGIVAVTTQVAEMSLDLDADLLISEIAPIPSLIQRLGRLNRRVTPENKGAPRKAVFVKPEDAPPYTPEELMLAEQWVNELQKLNRPLCQVDLAERFNALSPQTELRLDTRVAWLDSGWMAEPELVRDIGYSVSVIQHEDKNACLQSSAELIRRAIPMNYASVMKDWQEYKGHLIAPAGAIHYSKETGAVLLWK